MRWKWNCKNNEPLSFGGSVPVLYGLLDSVIVGLVRLVYKGKKWSFCKSVLWCMSRTRLVGAMGAEKWKGLRLLLGSWDWTVMFWIDIDFFFFFFFFFNLDYSNKIIFNLDRQKFLEFWTLLLKKTKDPLMAHV